MKKRLFAILLALTLALSLLPVAVFADGEDAAASNAQQEQQQEVVCVCEAACTAEGMNADCPICGAEGAAVERCGKYAAPAEDKAAQPADEEQPDTGAPDADKPAVEPAVQSADQGIAIQAAHTHCICGGNVNAGDHTAHSDVTYTAWNGTSGISYTNNTAYVYLTGNATLNGDLIVDGRTLYLCLNGKTLSSNGEKKVKVRNNARLVLCDCQGGGTIKGATKNVWGGGCVYLYTSTLDMFGGKLTGGKVTKGGGGGAIAMDDQQCIFNMYGGEISGNNGNNYGGAIFRKFDANKPNTTGGAFNMYGGTIKNNTAKNGGAFFSTTGGSINLTGGTISGNKATMSSNNAGGGAIYMRGCGTITITGSAEITGNSSSLDGGAILMGWGTITISDSARLTGNTASRWGGAICLCTDANKTSVLNMTGGEICNNTAKEEGGAVHVYGENATFYTLKGMVEALLTRFGVKNVTWSRSTAPYLHPGRAAQFFAGEKLLGVLGEVHPAVAENFKFKTRAYVAEMNLNVLDESATNVGDVKDMPRFPAVQRDFAFVMKEEMPVGDVMNEMKAVAGELCEEVHLFDIYRGVPIQPGEKSVALSITLRAADRTLGEEEITAISEKIIANVSAKFGAQLRS